MFVFVWCLDDVCMTNLFSLYQEGQTKVETSRPIVKVSGLPGGFSKTDVKKMLRALGVRSSIVSFEFLEPLEPSPDGLFANPTKIHFIINRRTFDKTSAEGIRTPFPIEDLYLEFKTSEYADVLVNAPRPTVAGKPVIVDRSDAAELRLALFPRLRNQTAKESYTLLSKEEIAALLDFCSRAEVSAVMSLLLSLANGSLFHAGLFPLRQFTAVRTCLLDSTEVRSHGKRQGNGHSAQRCVRLGQAGDHGSPHKGERFHRNQTENTCSE